MAIALRLDTLEIPESTPPRCRVLIADDHTLVRSSLRCLLETDPNIQVIAEADDGEDALAKITQFVPDVAVVDVTMPKLDGIEVIRRLSESGCKTRFVALSIFADSAHARDALTAGAAGYVPKSAAVADLLEAIYTVARGSLYVHPSMTKALLTIFRDPPVKEGLELSPREEEVLRMIAHGNANKEIAAQLAVSVKTVETYKERALTKIGGLSRVDIVRFAISKGWMRRAAP